LTLFGHLVDFQAEIVEKLYLSRVEAIRRGCISLDARLEWTTEKKLSM